MGTETKKKREYLHKDMEESCKFSSKVIWNLTSLFGSVSESLQTHIIELLMGYEDSMKEEILNCINTFINTGVRYKLGCAPLDFHLKLIYLMIEQEKEDKKPSVMLTFEDGKTMKLCIDPYFFYDEDFIDLFDK